MRTEFTRRRRRHSQHQDYVVFLQLDSLDWFRFQAFPVDHVAVKIRNVHRDGPDRLTVQCDCATAEVRDQLQDAWDWRGIGSCS
jgi:hypothetical protein